jgi:hypothetical protein
VTAPNQSDPDGAINVGQFATFQSMTEDDAKASMTGGTRASIDSAHNSHATNVVARIDGNYALVLEAHGIADQAVTTAQAAANDAAAAVETADIAYDNASFWSNEFVVSSAAVVLGVNELLLGPVLTVPDGLSAVITDIHFAFLTQPAGIVIETKKWNAAGTSSSVIHTATLGANVTRINYNALGISILDKERVFCNVTSVTGSIAPVVMQMAVAGAILF